MLLIRAVSMIALAIGLLRCSSAAHGPTPSADSNQVATGLPTPSSPTVVQTGLDRLIAENFAPLAGKKVGFITNQTSRTSKGEFGPHVFASQRVFDLVALYGPEHGIKGERQAGVTSDTLERFEGVPVYSLYGSTRKPTKQMLAGVNALVFDIQDVGVRPYTFLSTMILAMEAAAENGVAFYVLDRPNPLSGDRIEGNVLDPALKSFVGQVPVPYLHGMTLGELAQMAKAKAWFNASSALELHVVAMTGWKRAMYWPETGLAWTAPSPNVPHFENAVGLALFGATGELGVLSVGVGSDQPFLRLGSTIVPDSAIVKAATGALPFRFASDRYTATTSAGTKTYVGLRLDPANLKVTDLRAAAELYSPQYTILSRLLAYPSFRNALQQLPASTRAMYDKVTGRRGTRDDVLAGRIASIASAWRLESERFRLERKPYLLY